MDRQWHQLHGKLKRYLGRILKRPEDVEDIAQEAFVRVLEAGSKGEIHYHKAYLYRTAHNLALNSLARKSNLLVDYMEDFPDPDVFTDNTTLEDSVAAQQRFELFCRTAAELPEQCRRVLVLRKVYGLSQQEVADRLGISISTVEKHLAKGMLRCSARMHSLESPLDGHKPDKNPHTMRQSRRGQS
jgi:RNA polymerase sigma factor (sigma-70 family)